MSKEQPCLNSAYLAECLNDYKTELSESERAEQKAFEKMLARVVENLEGFVEDSEQRLMNLLRVDDPLLEMFIDDHYSQELVTKIPKIVARFKRLAPALVGKAPHKDVSVYLREASRCYLYGFPQSSIALCRAGLEQLQAKSSGLDYP